LFATAKILGMDDSELLASSTQLAVEKIKNLDMICKRECGKINKTTGVGAKHVKLPYIFDLHRVKNSFIRWSS
jgi:hypothetical protein